MGTRSDFVGKKKGVGVELDLRMQENQAAASGHKRLIGFPHHNSCYYNHNHDESQSQLSSSSSSWENISGGGGGVGAAGPGGSIFCNTSNQVAFMGDIYDVVGAASGSGSGTSNSAVLMSKSLNTCDSSLFPFNSLVGDQMAAAASVNLNVRVPFTAAQLQELERQMMIYKYMMASVPVPRELILPITKTPSRVPLSQSNSSVELGLLSNNNSDPEPWRCRRTDGKKWRCSRDVAPDQKYCERHSHKSRPRSRKPVEVPTHSSKNDQALKHSLSLASNKSQFVNQTMLSSMASSDEQPRCLEWFMKGQTMPVASNSNQEWHQKHLIDSNSCINLGADQNLTFQAHQRLVQDQYSLLVSPKLVSHQAPTQETRHFIDAWSMADENNANERLPFSPLALSMSGGSEIIERNENALMGGSLGIMGSERENLGTLRPHWMNHDSGMRSPPGGPLAEALCLGIASSAKLDSNAASPRGGCSTSTTTSSKSSGGDGSRSFNLTD